MDRASRGKANEAGLTDPNMLMVQKTFAAAPYFQLYYDQFLPRLQVPPERRRAGLFAGTLTPEQVAQALEDSVAAESSNSRW